MSALINKRFLIVFKDGSIEPVDDINSDHLHQVRQGNISIIDIKDKTVTESIRPVTKIINWKVVKVKDAIESKPLSKRNLD